MCLTDGYLIVRHLHLIVLLITFGALNMALAEEKDPQEVFAHNRAVNATQVYASLPPKNADAIMHFNPKFLHHIPGQAPVDLALFAYGNRVLPGIYLVDVVVNGRYIEQTEIRFDTPSSTAVDSSTSFSAQPCLNGAMLQRWGVDVQKLKIDHDDAQCLSLTEWITHSQVNFDMGQQKLSVSIPQVAMQKEVQGDISPAQWNDGVNAFILNYQLLAARYDTNYDGHNKKTDYSLNTMLQGGVNMGAWRFRYRANNSHRENQHRWQILETTATRDIKDWRSRLTLGDGFTPGDILTGISFRGVQIASDDAMLPDSLRGYAPRIQGVAQSQAQVTIKQNGYVLYTTFVAPGPFVIDDLLPNTSSGKLEIIVKEADGRSTTSYQSYAALPMQLREKSSRFHVAAGQYRTDRYMQQPRFIQGTLAYGLHPQITIYGGSRVANFYQLLLAGVGMNLGQYGSSALDMTYVQSENIAATRRHGNAMRWQYAKENSSTKTNFQIAYQRHFNTSFRTFTEAVDAYHLTSGDKNSAIYSRFDSTITQTLGAAVFSLSFGTARYWDGKNDVEARIGYSNQIKKINYRFDYSYQKTRGESNRQFSLSFNLPLTWANHFTSSTSINYSANSHFNGDVTHSVSSAGVLLENDSLSYGVGASQSNRSGSSGFFSLNVHAPIAQLNLNHTQGTDYATTLAMLGGGMVLHRGGLTLSQPLGDTVVLASVPGANNVEFENNVNVRTNRQGYAVLPSAVAYRRNRLALNMENVGDDIEIKNATLEVVPTRGAVVLAQYKVRQGHKALLIVRDQHDKPLPFGAQIFDPRGREAAMVGPGGQVYLTGIEKNDFFTAKWGEGGQARCQFQAPNFSSSTNKDVEKNQSSEFLSEVVHCH